VRAAIVLAAGLTFSVAHAQVLKGSTPVATAPASIHSAAPTMSPAQQQQLQSMITAHDKVRSQLAASDRSTLDQLTGAVKQQLFAAPWKGSLLGAATGIVSKKVPGLTQPEAQTLAEYSLGGIASGGAGMGGVSGAGAAGGASPIGSSAGGGRQDQLLNATKQMQETQMSFNLQYLQLQSQMQNENRSYTAVSNIMRTKHDVVKNSISNVR
jgi:hypothetical protein